MWNNNNNFFPMNQMNQFNLPFQINQMNQIYQINQMNMLNNFQQPANQINLIQNQMNLHNNINNNMNYNFNNNINNGNMQMQPVNNMIPIIGITNQFPINEKRIYDSLKLKFEHNHIMKNDLTEVEYFLYLFFYMIEIDLKSAKIMFRKDVEIINQNRDGTKLYINYYNIIKSEIYIDLDLPINKLINNIFEQIFCPYSEINFQRCLYKYLDILYLEFQGMNLSNLSGKIGRELGLKEGDELSLKLCQELFNELNTFPKDSSIHIQINRINIGHFTPRKGGLTKTFLKYFNNEYFHHGHGSSTNFCDEIRPGSSLNFITKLDVTAGKF